MAVVFAGCVSRSGVYHSVEGGQTIFSISRTYGVDPGYIARINGIEDPSRLRVGQRLFIPDAEAVRPLSAPSSTQTVLKKETSKPSVASAQRKPATPAPSARSLPVSPVAPKEMGRPNDLRAGRKESTLHGRFLWPLRGDVVRSYGRQGNQTCQGVEIAAPVGTPVLSAAAGRVTYSGKGIRGYGHLVILRHEGDLFTVYGFNQKSLVEAGATVHQGQRIALSGVPPTGGPPRLHFEIRQGKSPVNPIFYLP